MGESGKKSCPRVPAFGAELILQGAVRQDGKHVERGGGAHTSQVSPGLEAMESHTHSLQDKSGAQDRLVFSGPSQAYEGGKVPSHAAARLWVCTALLQSSETLYTGFQNLNLELRGINLKEACHLLCHLFHFPSFLVKILHCISQMQSAPKIPFFSQTITKIK